MRHGLRFRTPFTWFTLLLLAACGGGADKNASQAADEPSAAAEAPAEGAAPAADGAAAPAGDQSATTAPVTPADVDRWQKGMAGELAAVREGGAKLKSAKTSDDTLSAMMAVQEMGTQEAGAKAAGLDIERYKFIRSELSAAVSYMTPHLGGIDTTMLSPAQRDELRQSNEAQLKQMEDRVPADVVQALRPRAAELRKQNLELVAERLKSAGM
jgi:hypothetical protein